MTPSDNSWILPLVSVLLGGGGLASLVAWYQARISKASGVRADERAMKSDTIAELHQLITTLREEAVRWQREAATAQQRERRISDYSDELRAQVRSLGGIPLDYPTDL